MEQQTAKPQVCAFDFDGVIAQYEGFKGKEVANEPIHSVVEAIRTLKTMGKIIIIYSTRGNEFLRTYLVARDIPFDYINENPIKQGDNPGKPVACVYVDDRALCYRKQSAEELVEEILNFQPYWKKQ